MMNTELYCDEYRTALYAGVGGLEKTWQETWQMGTSVFSSAAMHGLLVDVLGIPFCV